MDFTPLEMVEFLLTGNDEEGGSAELAGGEAVRLGDRPEFSRKGHPGYLALLGELRELHLEKSKGYGTSRDPYANFSHVGACFDQPRFLYPVMRALEKITRIASLYDQGRVGEIEEELKDGASCLVGAAALLREDSASSPPQGED